MSKPSITDTRQRRAGGAGSGGGGWRSRGV